MDDPDKQKSDLTTLDSLSKCVAAAVGVLYLLGFLVVSAHLSRYGVSSFSVLQLQYLIAGGWVLAPPVALFSITDSARKLQAIAIPNPPGKFNWRGFLFSFSLPIIPYVLFWGIVVSIPGFLSEITLGMAIRLGLFYLGMGNSAGFLWVSWRVKRENENWLVNRQTVHFYLTLLLTLLLAFVLWFGARIYPLIPFSLGGGRPLTVAFIAGEKKLPDVIRADITLKRSVPYELLVTTDKSYVVLSPNPNEKSIEVSRDSVAGIVVLDDSHPK